MVGPSSSTADAVPLNPTLRRISIQVDARRFGAGFAHGGGET